MCTRAGKKVECSWQTGGGKQETVTDFKITVDGDCSHEIRHLLIERKAMTNLDCVKKQRHHLANKGMSNQSFGFSSSHVQMGELDHEEG